MMYVNEEEIRKANYLEFLTRLVARLVIATIVAAILYTIVDVYWLKAAYVSASLLVNALMGFLTAGLVLAFFGALSLKFGDK